MILRKGYRKWGDSYFSTPFAWPVNTVRNKAVPLRAARQKEEGRPECSRRPCMHLIFLTRHSLMRGPTPVTLLPRFISVSGAALGRCTPGLSPVWVLALCAPLRPGYGVFGLKRRRVHLCLCRCAWFPAPWWLSRAAPCSSKRGVLMNFNETCGAPPWPFIFKGLSPGLFEGFCPPCGDPILSGLFCFRAALAGLRTLPAGYGLLANLPQTLKQQTGPLACPPQSGCRNKPLIPTYAFRARCQLPGRGWGQIF